MSDRTDVRIVVKYNRMHRGWTATSSDPFQGSIGGPARMVLAQVGEWIDAPDVVAAVEAERDLYRRALIRIGNNESGHWGVIAREALKTAATSQEGQG